MPSRTEAVAGGTGAVGAAGAESGSRRLFVLVAGLFFLSGSAGLVYQVLWMRCLGLFFGSDMYGVSITLSTFMGGLALGSLLGGRLAERTRRPLMCYGIAEVGIGLAALPFAWILGLLDPLLGVVYAGEGDVAPWTYQLVRVLFATGTLLVPTTFMGATLPLVMKHFTRSRSVLGEMGASFYAINTLGALVGTLLGGFALLPYLGMTRSTWCAAGVNLAIGLACIAAGWTRPIEDLVGARRTLGDLDPVPGLELRKRGFVAVAALVAFGLSGFASFALEVIWTRILLMTFSATVYSFATTLACFLFGIFLGSRLIGRVVDRHANPIGLFAALELGVGASVAVLCILLPAVPGIFGELLLRVASALGDDKDKALVISTLLAAFPLLVVPATLLGATFPVALRVYTTSVAHVGRRTGDLYASNTVGAVLGSLAAGLFMIPGFGTMASLALVSALFLSIGTGLALIRPGQIERALDFRKVAPAAALALCLCLASLFIPYRVILNFSQKRLDDVDLLYHAEGVQNAIDVVRSRSGTTSLIIGGNVEADDSYRQRRHFILKGHLPLLMMDDPKTVLVVGLGMGITLENTARHPGLERIEVVELSPEILAAQQQLGAVNRNVIDNPLVKVRIDDGRLFMKLGRERFDMITADPIHPKISRVGYLYTKEYYESIRDHLNPGGVVCQWMPIYQISPRRLRSAVKTFIDVFPHATLWYVEGHMLLIAKLDSELIDYPLLARKFEDPNVREDLASIDIRSPEELLEHLVMGPDQIRAFVDAETDVPLNTDDFPYLEYFVPGDLFARTRDNVLAFARYLSDPATLTRGLPPGSRAVLDQLTAKRMEWILGDPAVID